MQTWPALRYLPAAAASAVFSGSTSSNTITGEWPPSSMVTRFIVSAASLTRCLPTGIEPVKEILRISGLAIRCSEISPGMPKTRLSTPAGKPASAKARAISTAVPGVSSEAFRISEQPAPSAPAILRAGVIAGKFHGVKAAQMPTGSCVTICRVPGSREGMMRP